MIWIENFGIKVWDVKPSEKFVDLRVSSSKKNKDGTWGTSSNWFPRCFGKAAQQAASFKRGDYVRVKKGYITNEAVEAEGKKHNVFNMTILEFDQPHAQVEGNTTEGDTDGMPY